MHAILTVIPCRRRWRWTFPLSYESTVSGTSLWAVIGADPIALPEPLDGPWCALVAAPDHDTTAAHPNSPWVFRGRLPGRHSHAGHLRDRLRTLFSARAARLDTLHELTKHAPVAVIADALGYAPATIEYHATASSAGYAQYIAAVRTSQEIDPTS